MPSHTQTAPHRARRSGERKTRKDARRREAAPIDDMKCSKCNHEYADHLQTCPVCGEPNPGRVNLKKEDIPEEGVASQGPNDETATTDDPTHEEGLARDESDAEPENASQSRHADASQYSWHGPRTDSSPQEAQASAGSGQDASSQQAGRNRTGGQEQFGQNGPNAQQRYGQGGPSSHQYGQGGYRQEPYGQQYGPPYQNAQVNRHPVAVLVLGILSIVVPVIGIVLGIIAIVLGSSARRTCTPGTTDYSMATAGWIMGIISVAVWGALVVFGIVVASIATSAALGLVGEIGEWFGSGAVPNIIIS